MISEFWTSGVKTPWVVAIAVVLALIAIAGVTAARRRGRLIRARLAHAESGSKDPLPEGKGVETILFICSLIPMLGVIGATMGVSFIGLQAFARDDMGFKEAALLVPLTLDGISISMALVSFVSAKRGRDSKTAERIVAASAGVSALLNFSHGWSTWTFFAGLYLGFLSMMSLYMFRELLAQFTATTKKPKADEHVTVTGDPVFGKRWLYAPWSTLCAHRAWIVHPPEETLTPTVRHALEHLDTTRVSQRAKKLARQSRRKIDTITAKANIEQHAAQLASGPASLVPGTPDADAYRPGTPAADQPYRPGTEAVDQAVPGVPVRDAIQPYRYGTPAVEQPVPAAVPAGADWAQRRPSPVRNGSAPYRTGTERSAAAVPSHPATLRPSVPPARNSAFDEDTEQQPFVNDRVAQFSQNKVEKDREELAKLAAAYIDLKTWPDIWSVGQNKLYNRTKIRKPRLKQLLEGDKEKNVGPLYAIYFPDGPADALLAMGYEAPADASQLALIAA